MAIFEHKRIDGKLIIVSFDYEDGIFSNVVISGDFFAFPEGEIDNLEKSVNGKNFLELENMLDNFFSSNVRVLGITKEDLTEIFKRAIDGN